MGLTHYIFVRRDLPLGVMAAMITHAAGESGALYGQEYDGRFRGATAVVLEAKDEADLNKIEDYIYEAGLRYVVITEENGTYAGQDMAIGVVPIPRADQLFSKYQTLKTCLEPVEYEKE